MPESGSIMSRLNTLPGLAVSALLDRATWAANPSARAANTLSGSGFSRCHNSIALRNSACWLVLRTVPASCQISASAIRQPSNMGRADSPNTFGCQCSSNDIRVTVTKMVMSSRLATAFGPEAMEQVSVPSAIFQRSTSAGSMAFVPRWSLSTPATIRVEYSSAKRNKVCCTSTGSKVDLF